MKTILWCSLLALVTTAPARAEEDCTCETLAEKRRVVTKTYSVSPKDRLAISNQHGEVRVELWGRNEVRAEITITGYGSTDEEAQSLLDAVEIEEERQGDLVRFETVYEGKSTVNAWWSRGGAAQHARERGVRINYIVQMPRYLPLDIRSRFSNAVIPEFSAPLTLRTEHGNVSAGRLVGSPKDIQVAYGKAVIKDLQRGKLDLSHTRLFLDRAEELELAYKHGQMMIKEVDKLIADLSYSRCQIEKLHESAQMKVAFLERFQLPELMNTVKNINIESSYSDVLVPVAPGTDMNFNVTVRFANFQYPAERVTFTTPEAPRAFRPLPGPGRVSPPEEPPSARSPQVPAKPKATRTYQGTVGKGGSKVKITSTYGNVRFER